MKIIFFLFFSLFSLSLQAIDKFIVVTPPKSGTHLLTKAMEQLTNKKCLNIFSTYVMTNEEWKEKFAEAEQQNGFIQIHARPDPKQIKTLKKLGYKVIFLLRDPRDQALSLLFYIDDKGWVYGSLSREREPYRSLSFDDKLDEIITGRRTGFCAVDGLFVKYLPWTMQGDQFILTVKFENLVGDEGGGSRQLQKLEVAKIAKFLQIKLSPQQLEESSQGLFGHPGEKTFRKGQIGEWRHQFKARHRNEINRRYGKIMQQFGYSN
jgi:hypothetical protein